MRPTRFGLASAAFYLAMLVAYYASPYANVSFLLLAFLTLAGALGVFWTLRNLRGVEAAVPVFPPVAAESPGRSSGPARVSVPGRRRRFGLRVELELEGGHSVAARLPVLRGDAVAALELPSLPRGIHRVRRATVGSSYPLGLFLRRRAIEAPADVAAYPAPGIETAARTGAEVLAEVVGGAGAADELQPAGLRDYAPGDELRRVHWRATARRGSPVVREWEGSGGGGLELQIDRRADPEELEAALGIASAVVHLAREQKDVLSLTSQGLQETYGDGHRPWDEVLRFLAGAEPLSPGGPPPPAVSPGVARLPARRRGGAGAPPRSRGREVAGG